MPARSDTLTVTQLTGAVKDFLEAGFPAVAVEGEISGLRTTSGRHLYFSLKDEGAVLRVVWFNWASRGAVPPEEGQKVRITGRLTVYEAQGAYQLVASAVETVGLGELLARLEALKQRLEAEGLFAPGRKRRLPPYPAVIGLVTSPTGAALQDMLRIFIQHRSPCLIRIFPAAVQGTEAPGQMAAQLDYAGSQGLADVLVLGRGGGSVEDLLAFSDERVVRAVARCPVPVVSAVGHEIDSPLCDWAADVRAPTPTAAAQLLAGPWSDLAERLAQTRADLARRAGERLQRTRLLLSEYRADRLKESLSRVLQPYYQRHDFARDGLRQAWQDRRGEVRRRLDLARTALEALNPFAVLNRGYVMVSDAEGRPVSDGAPLRAGQALSLRFRDGPRAARVEEDAHEEL